MQISFDFFEQGDTNYLQLLALHLDLTPFPCSTTPPDRLVRPVGPHECSALKQHLHPRRNRVPETAGDNPSGEGEDWLDSMGDEKVLMTEPHYELEEASKTVNPRAASIRRDAKAVTFNSEPENGFDEKRKSVRLTPTALPLNTDADLVEGKKKASVSRSPMQTPDLLNSSKLERKKSSINQFSKTNAHFHKFFKDVPEEELLKQSFTCALQKDLLYQGKLYISENWIGFCSKVFRKDTKIAIPVSSVIMIKKTKTALLVPNALVIATTTDRYIFVSLLSRDTTYKLLKSVCKHLENISVANSPIPSSTENSFRAERPTSLPLDFSVDFAELDGLVHHRRQELDEFSSTGSQSESENSHEFSIESQPPLKVTKPEKTSVRPDSHTKHLREGKARHTSKHVGDSRLQRLFHRTTSQQLLSLNGLLICYAVLVFILMVSTVYLRSKIMTLEERLAAMGPLFVNEQSQERLAMRSLLHVDADAICNELTTNLAKLDKIQKNLQRLLENMA